MIIIFLILSLFDKPLPEKLQLLRGNIHIIALAGFAVMMFAGVTYSENKTLAWFAIEKKAFFILLPIAFATCTPISERVVKNILSLFCAACFIALVTCYFQAWQQFERFRAGEIGIQSISYLSSSDFWQQKVHNEHWLFFSYVALASGIKMHPTYLSMYAAFCVMILAVRSLESSLSRWKPLGLIALIAFFTGSIVLLASRAVLATLLFFLVALLLYELIKRSRLLSGLSLLIFIALLIAGMLINPVTRYRQVDEIVLTNLSITENKTYNNSTSIRASLWWLSTRAYLKSDLLFGAGTGDVEARVKQVAEQYGVKNVLNTYNPHNQYLFILIGMGALGLLLFLGFVVTGILKAWQHRDIVFLGFMTLFLAVCFTESVLEMQRGVVFFSIFFSVLPFQRSHVQSPSLKLASVRN